MKRPERSEILFYLSILKEEMQEYGLEIEGLFGSFAQGEEGGYSDIDIAVRKIPAFRERFSAYDYFSALEPKRCISQNAICTDHRRYGRLKRMLNAPSGCACASLQHPYAPSIGTPDVFSTALFGLIH